MAGTSYGSVSVRRIPSAQAPIPAQLSGAAEHHGDIAIHFRRDQIFPKLEPLDIERVCRFADLRFSTDGERLIATGQVVPGLVVVLAGGVATTHERQISSALCADLLLPGSLRKDSNPPAAAAGRR